MAILITLGIVTLFFAAIAGGVAGLIVRLNRARPRSARPPITSPNWELPEADCLPYLKRKYFFSAAERSFYEVLKRVVPAEYTVFAKVRLADLVYVSKGAGSRQSHFNRINRKHIDFALCNRDLAPLVAIELDDASHDEEEREERDEFVDAVLAAAAVPIVHIRARRGYALDELGAALRPYLPAKPPREVSHPDERYMPPQGWRPAV